MRLRLILGGIFFITTAFADQGFSVSETYQTQRKDGSIITYYLKRPSVLKSVPILLVLQGSQSESVYNHGVAQAGIPDRYSSALLMIEKPGVSRGSLDCNDEYLNRNSLAARVGDVEFVLSQLKDKGWWNGKIYLLGGSEGGALAVQLSEVLKPVNKAVILVTGGGLTMAEVMPGIIRESMQGAPEAEIQKKLNELPTVFADIKANPESTKTFFGQCYTYRYWSSLLWYRPLDSMLKTKTSYLLIHGTRDLSHPVESARITARAFSKQAPDRLVYWEKEGLDHSLSDSQGKSHMQDVVTQALYWLFE